MVYIYIYIYTHIHTYGCVSKPPTGILYGGADSIHFWYFKAFKPDKERARTWTCFDTIILLVPHTERGRTWSWLMMIFHTKVHNSMRSACFFVSLFPIQNALERGVGSKFSKANEIE